MRSIQLLWMAPIFVVSSLNGSRSVEAQLSSDVGQTRTESISYPFTKPGELFNASKVDGIDSLAELDWNADPEAIGEDPNPDEEMGEGAADVVQISNELVIPPTDTSEVEGEMIIIGDPATAGKKCGEEANKQRRFRQLATTPYSVYRSDQQNIRWLPGSGDDFGMVNWADEPYLEHDEDAGFSSTINVHWLSGPTAVPLQSRVFDFILGYQKRGNLSPGFSYDMATSIGVYSDFEGSAREGVRFPSHAVGMFHFTHGVDLVFGVDYLDRDDITLLPVIGVSLPYSGIEGLRLDLIFPRPRITYTLNNKHRMYVAGELGGGSWDVELAGVANSVATYRDYQVVLGFESANENGSLSAWEFGYVFDRSLEFRGPIDSIGFDDAFMINWVTRR